MRRARGAGPGTGGERKLTKGGRYTGQTHRFFFLPFAMEKIELLQTVEAVRLRVGFTPTKFVVLDKLYPLTPVCCTPTISVIEEMLKR